ncbi:hypothetical protein AVEN_955-1 [Araneus ventricosus]|uniref:Uncharacterized protein n=1 Tax=Araneus ventricosus TaxID=182803 RepID=A0A4Y2CXD2_ARAVE|nr:hypothetical protein AVEN_955-1 [Araneus ventricosus]
MKRIRYDTSESELYFYRLPSALSLPFSTLDILKCSPEMSGKRKNCIFVQSILSLTAQPGKEMACFLKGLTIYWARTGWGVSKCELKMRCVP